MQGQQAALQDRQKGALGWPQRSRHAGAAGGTAGQTERRGGRRTVTK